MDGNGPPASPRGRSMYPAHLARAGEGSRVPLHRRGTSQKFECFEDLLREAGFKETRVFTPEAERAEAAAEVRKKQAERKREGRGTWLAKNGATGLVEYLSGLVSWSDAEGNRGTVESRYAKTQSLGRAGGKQTQALLDGDDDDDTGVATGSSNALVTPTPNHRRPFTPVILAREFSSPGSSSSTSSRSPPQPYRYGCSRPKTNHVTSRHPNHSRRDAQTTLRHMISMPNFTPERRTFHPPHSLSRRVTEHAASRPGSLHQKPNKMRSHGSKPNLRWQREPTPPLPQNWLSTIAQAVVGAAGTSVRVGHPQKTSESQERARTLSTRARPTHSTLDGQRVSEYGRRDGSLTCRGFAPCTPRGDTVPSVVTPASVVCRSAPGSRSSSLVRKPSTGTRTRNRPQTRRRDPCLPSLGVTSIQLAGSGRIEDEDNESRYDNDESHASTGDAEESYDDESSDEGEPDFARLIVPARRQHSIQSLRRHLHNHAVAATASRVRKPPPSAFNRVPKRNDSQIGFRGRPTNRQSDVLQSQSGVLDNPDDLLRGRRVSADEDAEDEVLVDWVAHGLPGLGSGVRKKRGTIPWTG